MGAGYAEAQARTTRSAESNGERWESEDLEFVIAFTDDVRDEDIAVALGRTLSSIWSIQYRLRHDGIDATRTFYARRNATRVEIGYDYVTTFPVGWND